MNGEKTNLSIITRTALVEQWRIYLYIYIYVSLHYFSYDLEVWGTHFLALSLCYVPDT